ncbi:hypothetical protein KIPB_010612, partial [Kipferlia bialata]
NHIAGIVNVDPATLHIVRLPGATGLIDLSRPPVHPSVPPAALSTVIRELVTYSTEHQEGGMDVFDVTLPCASATTYLRVDAKVFPCPVFSLADRPGVPRQSLAWGLNQTDAAMHSVIVGTGINSTRQGGVRLSGCSLMPHIPGLLQRILFIFCPFAGPQSMEVGEDAEVELEFKAVAGGNVSFAQGSVSAQLMRSLVTAREAFRVAQTVLTENAMPENRGVLRAELIRFHMHKMLSKLNVRCRETCPGVVTFEDVQELILKALTGDGWVPAPPLLDTAKWGVAVDTALFREDDKKQFDMLQELANLAMQNA